MRVGRRTGLLTAGLAGALALVVGGATTASAAVTYPVAPGVRLTVRSGPGTTYQVVDILALGASVSIRCRTPGETIAGYYGTTNIWDNIANGEYVSDAYVHTGSDGYVTQPCG